LIKILLSFNDLSIEENKNDVFNSEGYKLCGSSVLIPPVLSSFSYKHFLLILGEAEAC